MPDPFEEARKRFPEMSEERIREFQQLSTATQGPLRARVRSPA